MPREREGVRRLALDPDRERPKATVREPRLERPRDPAAGAAPGPQALDELLVPRRHRTEQEIGVADAIFVSDVTVAVAPCSSGRWRTAVATVLSTTSGAPASPAILPSASRSATRSSGFVGVSAHRTDGAPAVTSRTASRSCRSTGTGSTSRPARSPASVRIP